MIMLSSEKTLNDCPHPGPLHQERENRSPVSCIAQSSCLSLFIQHEELTNGGNPTDFRAIKNSRLLFPLPGGEGQGEGERNT
jgi:hypothetical protein